MKLRYSAFLFAMLGASATVAQDTVPQVDNDWYKAGQAMLAEKAAVTPITTRAKNVIVLVADGNSVGTNYATRLWDGQQNGNMGDEHVLHHETFPHLALSKTYNTNAQTPDSAGTATAIHAGVKAKSGVVGVDETVNRGDCAATEGGVVASIGEILSGQGKAIGVVSTARVTHATPSSVYAHAADRSYEDDSKLPEGCTYPDIAEQLLNAIDAGTIQVAMGGGRRHFIPADFTDDEGKNGKRIGGRNLVEEAMGMGVQYAWNDETAAALNLDGSAPILGLFESSHMKYEYDRSGEPSLAEMTAMAITALANDSDGFFLSIEGGRVDHANHAGNLHRVVTDGVAFAEAVAMADEMTDDNDTLIVVTADHGHALAFGGYCGRGTPITGLCYGIDNNGVMHTGEPQLGSDGKPYTVAGYLNGAGSVLREDMDWSGSRGDLTQEEATDPEYLQQALIPRKSETHSGEDVAIYAKGPFAHLLNGTVEQSFIYHVMHHAATVN